MNPARDLKNDEARAQNNEGPKSNTDDLTQNHSQLLASFKKFFRLPLRGICPQTNFIYT